MTAALIETLSRLEAAMRRHGIALAEIADATGRIRLGVDPAPDSAQPVSVPARAAGRFQPLRAPGDIVRKGEIIALLEAGAILRPVLAPVAGRLTGLQRAAGAVTGYGDAVAEIAAERNS